jgi:hypothetical protein
MRMAFLSSDNHDSLPRSTNEESERTPGKYVDELPVHGKPHDRMRTCARKLWLFGLS